MPPRAAAASAQPSNVVQGFPEPIRRRRKGEDPHVAALNAQAEAMQAMATAITAAVVAFQPAADTVHGFGARMDGLCDWLRKKGPWLMASVPGVLLAINAISPNAAKALSTALQAAGVQ